MSKFIYINSLQAPSSKYFGAVYLEQAVDYISLQDAYFMPYDVPLNFIYCFSRNSLTETFRPLRVDNRKQCSSSCPHPAALSCQIYNALNNRSTQLSTLAISGLIASFLFLLLFCILQPLSSLKGHDSILKTFRNHRFFLQFLYSLFCF